MAVWLATAVILAALSAVVAHADCGFDQLQRLNVQLNESVFVGRFRRDSNSGNQDFGDTRFRVPSRSRPFVRTAECSRYDSNEFLGFGYSECYIPEVIESYQNVPSWPPVVLKTAIVALQGAGGAKWVSDADMETAMTAVSAEFTTAGISFQQDRELVDNAAMYTKYDQLNNNKGMGISDIGPFISDMSRVISLPARGRDRVYHSYIFVTKMDISVISGICFPDIMMLEIRPEDHENQLSSSLGNLCIVDYRYFLSAGQTGADARSLGKVTIHELGHSLGLLHPHAGVDFTSNSLPNPVCLSGGARTRGCRVPANDVTDFLKGDMLSDTAPMPNMYFVANGTAGTAASSYNTATCAAGSSFPKDCSGQTFAQISTMSRNHMGYGVDGCRSTFTAQQVARMRCFVDRYVSDARRASPATQLPLVLTQPRYQNVEGTSVLVEWFPPLTLLRGDDGRASSLPSLQGLQYVVTRTPAFSSGSTLVLGGSTYSYTDEAVTPPLDRYSYTVHAVLNGVAGVMGQPVQASQYIAAGYHQLASWVQGLAIVSVICII